MGGESGSSKFQYSYNLCPKAKTILERTGTHPGKDTGFSTFQYRDNLSRVSQRVTATRQGSNAKPFQCFLEHARGRSSIANRPL